MSRKGLKRKFDQDVGMTCYHKAVALYDKQKYNDALSVTLIGITKYQNHTCYVDLLLQHIHAVDWESDKRRQKVLNDAEHGDIAAIFLVATMFEHGVAGFHMDMIKAIQWYERGAALNNPFCIYKKGYAIYRDYLHDDFKYSEICYRDDVIEYFHIAAASGVAFACYHLAYHYEYMKDIHQSALYYLLSVKYGIYYAVGPLQKMKASYPMEVVPWDRWKPDPEIHSLVPSQVQSAMFTWLLISKRIALGKDLSRIILSYITTRGIWNKRNISERE